MLFQLAFLAAAMGAAAEQSAQPPAEQAIEIKGKVDKRDKVVCKVEESTGSLFPKKDCRTRAEWESIRQRSIRALQEQQKDESTARHTGLNRDR